MSTDEKQKRKNAVDVASGSRKDNNRNKTLKKVKQLLNEIYVHSIDCK